MLWRLDWTDWPLVESGTVARAHSLMLRNEWKPSQHGKAKLNVHHNKLMCMFLNKTKASNGHAFYIPIPDKSDWGMERCFCLQSFTPAPSYPITPKRDLRIKKRVKSILPWIGYPCVYVLAVGLRPRTETCDFQLENADLAARSSKRLVEEYFHCPRPRQPATLMWIQRRSVVTDDMGWEKPEGVFQTDRCTFSQLWKSLFSVILVHLRRPLSWCHP